MRNVIEVDVDRNQIVFVGNTYDGGECESCINFIVSDDVVVILTKDGVEQLQKVMAVDGNACYIINDALLRSAGEFTVATAGIVPMRFVIERDIPEGKTFSIRLSTNGSLCVRCAETSSSSGATGVASWYDITDKPSAFPPASHSHAWDAITDKPSAFPPATHSHAWDAITDKPSTFPPTSHSHAWDAITDKPSTFPPASHSHALNMELIWENPDISSDFGGSGIAFQNKPEFQFFIVTMQPNGTVLDKGNCISAIVPNGGGNTLIGIVGGKLARRRVIATQNTYIQFGTGYSFDEYGSALVENTQVMKPVCVYGIR